MTVEPQIRDFSLLPVVAESISIYRWFSKGLWGGQCNLAPSVSQAHAAPTPASGSGRAVSQPYWNQQSCIFLLIIASLLGRGEMWFGEAGSDKQGGDRSCHLP